MGLCGHRQARFGSKFRGRAFAIAPGRIAQERWTSALRGLV